MTRRLWATAIVAGLLAGALCLLGPVARTGVRLAAVLITDVPVGAVLMLAIGRLVGADWNAFRPLTIAMPIAAVVMIVLLNTTMVPLPEHLMLWQHPIFVAGRTLILFVALASAAAWLPGSEGKTGAALILTGYAMVVTPIGADWLLGEVPGHPVSAVGMMLVVQQIGSACAAAILLGAGERRSRDFAMLLVAAMLGLGYLAFMDFLIVWFGNLPARVPFYVGRTEGLDGAVACLALVAGIGGTIGALSLVPGEPGRRIAAVCALVAIVLFDAWWLAAGAIGLAVALAVLAATIVMAGGLPRRAHD